MFCSPAPAGRTTGGSRSSRWRGSSPWSWAFRFVLPRGFCGWRGAGGSGWDRAHTILAERYARGEIDETEYRTRLDRLRSDA